MSRRDARKALNLALPEALRKALVQQSEAHVPLAYLVRQTLRRALDAGLGWQDQTGPGDRRPILLQLNCEERARLEMWTTAKKVSDETAVLSLIATLLEEEAGKTSDAPDDKPKKR